MKTLLLLIGLISLVVGLLWVGQGLGYVKWPASSFMINQVRWAYYGAALAIIGLILIFYTRH